MRVKAYIGLGSNLGPREDYLQRALDALRRHPSLEVTRVSPVLEPDPVGGPPDQGRYLNALAEVETALPPDDLLRLLLDVERSLGRERGERFGPRTIDLDILLYANVVREGTRLVEHRFRPRVVITHGDRPTHRAEQTRPVRALNIAERSERALGHLNGFPKPSSPRQLQHHR